MEDYKKIDLTKAEANYLVQILRFHMHTSIRLDAKKTEELIKNMIKKIEA